MVKTIAYFLPQYHEIEENNNWWGKGFTEWVNLKKSHPLFVGHRIARPYNNNYYNLLDKETVIWQSQLLNDYNVHGLCYYHYWFKGKKLLEKPAENLLKWSDIDQKFMFMWANHDWTKSWIGQKELLIKQEYGVESDWLEHVDYLMSFFKDDRYIKINNKPVFQIYISNDISDFDKMIELWNQVCLDNGFDGIYIIENVDNVNFPQDLIYHRTSSAINIMEHSAAINYWRKFYFHEVIFGKIRKMFAGTDTIRNTSYDIVVENSVRIMKNLNLQIKVFFGVSTGWDNTPRYGSRGYIISNSTPNKFKEYLKMAKEISELRNQEIIFISCWNEWCEGMCLEPSDINGFGYLEAVKEVFETK
jgi:hypothetical protein